MSVEIRKATVNDLKARMEETHWIIAGWRNGSRKLFIATIMLVLSIALLGVSIVLNQTRNQAIPNPLGEYPVQKVSDDIPREANGLPYVQVDEVVTIIGIKCNKTDQPVTVRGALEWKRVNPPGKIIQVFEGTGTRQPGCVTQVFENDVPNKVKEDILERGVSVWSITGIEVPIVDGIKGQPRAFQTENFRVVP